MSLRALILRGLPLLGFMIVAFALLQIKQFHPAVGLAFLAAQVALFIITIRVWVPKSH